MDHELRKNPLAHWLRGPCLLLAAVFVGGCQSGADSSDRVTLASASSVPQSDSTAEERAIDMQLALARTLERDGSLDRAASIYQYVLEEQPGNPEAAHRLAVVYGRQGRLQESLELFDTAARRRPDDADLSCDRGYTLYQLGEFPDSERELRRTIELAPDHARAHNLLGMLLAQRGACEEALGEFDRAGCSEGEARLNLAFALTLAERFPDARQEYDRAAQAGAEPARIAAGSRLLDRGLVEETASNGGAIQRAAGP
jgi:Flp pilus assembly protein TadD